MHAFDRQQHTSAARIHTHRLHRSRHAHGRATVLESVDESVAGIVILGGLLVLLAVFVKMRRRPMRGIGQ